MKLRIAAVIPNWNGAHLLRAYLPTVFNQSTPFESVIVADNGSRDDSLQVAEELGARVLKLEENRGFAVAVNRGIALAAEADIVVILNNDVALAFDWLARISAAFADFSVCFATGKLLSEADPKVIDGTFDAICRGGCALRCGAGTPDKPFWDRPRTIQFAPMTAAAFRRNVFLSLGGLDEAFESYLEDVEFGLRCASNGYTGYYEPLAVAHHRGSATLGAWSSRTVRYVSRNQLLLLARHYDDRVLLRFGWPIAVSQVLWGLVAIRHGRGAAWVAGKIEGLRLFRSLRRAGMVRLPEILRSSECEIEEVQREAGRNLYWRLYFALTTRDVRE